MYMKKPSFFICLILSSVLLLISLFAFRKDNKTYDDLLFQTIEIWQVDTFEGGINSRAGFLKSVAQDYEKKNKRVLISVRQMTVEGVLKALKEGALPDIISYGAGLEEIKPYAQGITTSVKSPFYEEENGKVLALGWAYGVYVKIEKKGDSCDKLIVSQNTYNQPLLAYYFNDLSYENVEVLSPKDAYSKFNLSKNVALLGTQRDLFRLSNKEVQIEIQPLIEFSDLVQYVSILSTDNNKAKILSEFVELLLLDFQEKIPSKIGLLPVSNLQNNVNNEVIGALFDVKVDKTISVFKKREELFLMQKDAFLNYKNIEFFKVVAKSNAKLLK